MNYHKTKIYHLSFSIDGKKLLSGSSDNVMCLCNWLNIFKKISIDIIIVLVTIIRNTAVNKDVNNIVFNYIYGICDGFYFPFLIENILSNK